MSVPVLLTSLNKLAKQIKCEAYQTFYFFFAMSSLNSIMQEHDVRFFLTIGH